MNRKTSQHTNILHTTCLSKSTDIMNVGLSNKNKIVTWKLKKYPVKASKPGVSNTIMKFSLLSIN